MALESGGRLQVCIHPAFNGERSEAKLLSESPRFEIVSRLFPDLESTDNRILASAAYVADTQRDGILVARIST